MIQCPQCKTGNQPTARFCNACGLEFISTPAKKKSNYLPLIIVVSVIAFFGTASLIRNIVDKYGANNKTAFQSNSTPLVEGAFSPSNRSDLQKRIRARLGKSSPKWKDIEFDKVEDNAVTIHLNYAKMPSSMAEVETDTERIAQAVIDELVAQNYNPKDKWLQLFVHAQKHEQGASGANMVRRFGKASYNFNNDRIEFSEAGSFY